MIDKVIRWSLRYRVIVIALALAFVGWGAFVLRDMPLDVLPDLSAPTVTIIVEGRGMVPTEMESVVTFPIEAALNGASGVRRVPGHSTRPANRRREAGPGGFESAAGSRDAGSGACLLHHGRDHVRRAG